MADRELFDQLDQAIESVLAGARPAASDGTELAVLAAIADGLRRLPTENLKTRLKKELERRATMTAAPTVTAVRGGFRTITPFIIHEKAPELVDFLKRSFGAEETKRNIAGEHSEVLIGDSKIMIAGGAAARHGNVPGAFHLFVGDCDATYRRAIEAGASTLAGAQGEPANRPYGERSAFVEDAFGNYWYIATPLSADAPPRGSVVPYVHPERARTYIDFLTRAFGAEQPNVVEHSGRVMHASVRIGDAVLEMGEAADRAGIPSNGFFLFVNDVEDSYKRALAAGAITVRPPQDIPSGLRSAIVKDPSGYLWWPAQWLS